MLLINSFKDTFSKVSDYKFFFKGLFLKAPKIGIMLFHIFFLIYSACVTGLKGPFGSAFCGDFLITINIEH